MTSLWVESRPSSCLPTRLADGLEAKKSSSELSQISPCSERYGILFGSPASLSRLRHLNLGEFSELLAEKASLFTVRNTHLQHAGIDLINCRQHPKQFAVHFYVNLFAVVHRTGFDPFGERVGNFGQVEMRAAV